MLFVATASPPESTKVYTWLQWSEWSTWSSCSVTCGTGSQTRYKVCNLTYTAAESTSLNKTCQESGFQEIDSANCSLQNCSTIRGKVVCYLQYVCLNIYCIMWSNNGLHLTLTAIFVGLVLLNERNNRLDKCGFWFIISKILFVFNSEAPTIPGFKSHLLDEYGERYIYTCSNDTDSIQVGSSNVTCPVALYNNTTDRWSTFDAECIKGTFCINNSLKFLAPHKTRFAFLFRSFFKNICQE